MPISILVLHGYGQCAYYAFRKLAPLMLECRDQVKFYFVDAPMIMVPADLCHSEAQFRSTDTQRTPRSSKLVPSCSTPTMRPLPSQAHCAWFRLNFDFSRNNDPRIPIDIENACLYLRDILKDHRFDAIFGFSQGAAIAERIAAMLERPYLFPKFCENGVAPHPPLNFITCVSGFLIRGPLSWEADPKPALANPEYGFSMNTPVLHVLGQNDIVVPPERSNVFVQHSKFSRVEKHNGGHFIPLHRKWREFFVSFLLNPFAEIASPTSPTSPTSPLSAFTDKDFMTLSHTELYQTGQLLPSPVDTSVTYEKKEEEPHLPPLGELNFSDSELTKSKYDLDEVADLVAALVTDLFQAPTVMGQYYMRGRL